jgi:hypothetical protein
MTASATEQHARGAGPGGAPEGAPGAGPGPGPDLAAAQQFLGRVVADMSSAMGGVLCALGVRLGLFQQLAASGPATSEELAAAAGLDERYLREWLYGMASAGYLEVDRAQARYSVPPGVAAVLAAEGSPVDMTGGYRLLPALTGALDAVTEAFRTGEGVSQDRYPAELYAAMEQMSSSWLNTMYVHMWIPAVEGLARRLGQGGRVADIGCGGGRALVLGAQAFPASEFVGYDMYPPNVERARAAAEEAGVGDRVHIVQADAATALHGHFDLVTAFDVLHDAPDPAGLLRRIRAALDPDGVLLLLESRSADDPLDNAGPQAVILYATSVLYCLPTSCGHGGAGLGTLGLPPGRIRDLCGSAGFRSIRPVPNPNPFNALYEIRP